VALPAGPDGEKQGLDDYLVVHGGAALQGLLDGAQDFPEANALWQMNEELVLIQDPGLVVERASGWVMDPRKFVVVHYANKHYMAMVKDRMIKKPLAPRWMEWEQRFELDRICYAPGQQQIYNNQFNVWKGWGLEPKEGGIGPWNWLMNFIFKQDVATRQWFEMWCAYPIQYPGTKMYSAVVLWSVMHGTGKSFVGYILGKIYGTNFIEIDNSTLKKTFNSWAAHKQFIMGSEITGGQARIDADKLKGMITQPKIIINPKYIPEYVVDDCNNYLFTSNHPDAIFVEDHDRRFLVHEIAGNPAPRAYYEELDAWFKGDGPAALFHYFKNMNLENFNPREAAPMTEAKRNMILSSKSEVAAWVQRLREDPETCLRPLGQDVARRCNVFSAADLLRAMDPQKLTRVTTNGMGRALQASGLRQLNESSPIRCATGLQRLYAIRNESHWLRSEPRDSAAHYNEFFPAFHT
jgi:hypothetical protein